MLHEKTGELPAPLDDVLEGGALDAETVVEGDALHVDTVAGEQLYVGVVDEADAVQVDHAQVRGVSTDLADVDDLIDLLFLIITKFKRS